MRKITYRNIASEIKTAEESVVTGAEKYDYDPDTLRYAAELFLSKNEDFIQHACKESWNIRISSGKARKKQPFNFIISAPHLDLHGKWVTISGHITEAGAEIEKIELLGRYPSKQKPA